MAGVVSYEIGAIFALDGAQAEATLGRLGGLFDTVATSMREMKAAGEGLFAGLSTGLDGLASAARKAATGLDRAAMAAKASGDAAAAASGPVDNLARSWTAAAEAAGRYAGASAGAGAARAGEGFAGGGGPGSSIVPSGGGAYGPYIVGAAAGRLMNESSERGRIVDAEFNQAYAHGLLTGPGGAGGGGGGGALATQGGRGFAFGTSPMTLNYAETAPKKSFGVADAVMAATLYEGIKSAANEDLAIRNSLEEGLNIRPNDPAFEPAYKRLQGLAATNAQGTIVSEKTVADMIQTTTRELGFTGMAGIGKLEQILPPIVMAAEVAKMTGLGTYNESARAGIEYSHMTDTYEGASLEHRLNTLRSAAQRTGRTMLQEETIAKYVVPIGMAAGMDPDTVLKDMAFTQQSGFNSSTAGTGLSAMILGSLETGGPMTAMQSQRLNAGRREFEATLGLQPGEGLAQTGGKDSAHIAALKELRIVDAAGKSTITDAQGNASLDAIEQRIFDYARTHTRDLVLKNLHAGFGTRGERVASIFTQPDSLDRRDRMRGAIAESPTARDIQRDLATSPMQQGEQILARLSDIANATGQGMLPGILRIEGILLAGLNAANAAWHKTPDAIRGDVGFGIAGALIKGAGSVAEWAAKKKGGTGIAGRMLGGLGSGLMVFEAASGALDVMNWGADQAVDAIVGGDTGTAKRLHEQMQENNPYGPIYSPGLSLYNWWNRPGVKPGPRPENLSLAGVGPSMPSATNGAIAGGEPRGAAGGTTVNVGPITLNGMSDAGVIAKIMQQLTDAIASAMAHSTAAAHGTTQSHYVTNGSM